MKVIKTTSLYKVKYNENHLGCAAKKIVIQRLGDRRAVKTWRGNCETGVRYSGRQEAELETKVMSHCPG